MRNVRAKIGLVDHLDRRPSSRYFALCIIPTRILRHINPLEKLSTSSEVPQNHNDLPSTRSQALPP